MLIDSHTHLYFCEPDEGDLLAWAGRGPDLDLTRVDLEPGDGVLLYTDGACSGNPGPGGWAYILKHPSSGKETESAGAEPLTTNNRMELLAAISALEALGRATAITVVTDSAYVKNGVSQWIHGWKAKGWKTADKKPVKNQDLIEALDEERRSKLWARLADFDAARAAEHGRPVDATDDESERVDDVDVIPPAAEPEPATPAPEAPVADSLPDADDIPF